MNCNIINYTHIIIVIELGQQLPVRVSLITGLQYGLEWTGTIRNSEITTYTFFPIAVLHYKRLYCIMLQVVNIVFMS